MKRPYQLLAPLTPERAHIRFAGRFEGRPVTWEAVIERVRGAPQYIDIGEASGEVRPVRIGLQVEALDESELHKAVIMIQQYKRLRRGRHEFEPGGAAGKE